MGRLGVNFGAVLDKFGWIWVNLGQKRTNLGRNSVRTGRIWGEFWRIFGGFGGFSGRGQGQERGQQLRGVPAPPTRLGRVFALLGAALAREVFALDVPKSVPVVEPAGRGKRGHWGSHPKFQPLPPTPV